MVATSDESEVLALVFAAAVDVAADPDEDGDDAGWSLDALLEGLVLDDEAEAEGLVLDDAGAAEGDGASSAMATGATVVALTSRPTSSRKRMSRRTDRPPREESITRRLGRRESD